METPGEWLEKALLDLCKKVETGLDLDQDIILSLVSYFELAEPVDAKEYLDVMALRACLDGGGECMHEIMTVEIFGQKCPQYQSVKWTPQIKIKWHSRRTKFERTKIRARTSIKTVMLSQNIIGKLTGKVVIDEYMWQRGYSHLGGGGSGQNASGPDSGLQAYVKPPSVEVSSSVEARDLHGYQEVIFSLSDQENQGFPWKVEPMPPNPSSKTQNLISSRKKKSGKVVSPAEATKGSIVLLQGKPCTCQAHKHRLVSNCLSCGKIVCEQEGEGPCSFCGALLLKEGSQYAGLNESVPVLTESEAAAEAYAKRLAEDDRNSAARTTVIDDQSDYCEIEGNSWLSEEEKELLRKKKGEIEEAELAQRSKVVVTFDLVGRKILFNQDEGLESGSR